jgi:hypothetical protein
MCSPDSKTSYVDVLNVYRLFVENNNAAFFTSLQEDISFSALTYFKIVVLSNSFLFGK